MFTFVLIAVLFFGFIFSLVMAILQKKRKKKRDKRFGKGEFLGKGKFPLLAGLHLPENAMCVVYCLKSGIVIETLGQEFSLSAEKIVDVSVMRKSEIQRQYVSSAGGAVAGAMVMGPLGALLGGGISQRTIRNTKEFLIFTYRDTDADEMKYIIFDSTERTAARYFTNAFKSLKYREKVQIDL